MTASDTVTLTIIPNDRGPVGTRTYPAEPYPRPFVSVSLLCGFDMAVGTITLPATLSAAEWDLMLECLAVMRAGFVR